MTRREREEALLKNYEPHDIDILASALTAAHRREDAIRALQRYELATSDDEDYLRIADVLAILDAGEDKT